LGVVAARRSLSALSGRRAQIQGLIHGYFPQNGTVDTIERELEQLRHRRSLLDRQREVAEASLAKALADRRRILLEADLDKTNGDREPVRRLVERLRDENDSVVDAIGALDRQIGEAEMKLAAEREVRARDAERVKRQEALNAARNVLARYREISAELVDALALLAPCGPMCATARANVEYISREMPAGVESAFVEAASYIAMVASGDAPIRIEAAPVTPPTPPPAIERKQIFLRHPGRWVEAGEHHRRQAYHAHTSARGCARGS
jgi:hypothetical protein